MSATLSQNIFSTKRDAFITWRESSSLVQKILAALAMAAFTGLAAQVAIPLPGTPVPITGQTFAVLLSGVVLGKNWGGISQALYVAIGACGLPWFAGALGGVGFVFGPTGGYLMGFIFAAWFLGAMTNDKIAYANFFSVVGLMWFASFVLIQIPGLLGLALWHKLALGSVPNFYALLSMGFLPFVVGDVIKIILASSFAKALTR